MNGVSLIQILGQQPKTLYRCMEEKSKREKIVSNNLFVSSRRIYYQHHDLFPDNQSVNTIKSNLMGSRRCSNVAEEFEELIGEVRKGFV